MALQLPGGILYRELATALVAGVHAPHSSPHEIADGSRDAILPLRRDARHQLTSCDQTSSLGDQDRQRDAVDESRSPSPPRRWSCILLLSPDPSTRQWG